MKSNLIKRAVTGALFVIVLVGAILYSPITFIGLFAFISAYTTYELTGLLNQSGRANVNQLITSLGSLCLFIAFAGYSYLNIPIYVFTPYLIIVLYLFVSELYKGDKLAIENLGFMALSHIYIGLFFALMNLLVFVYTENGIEYHPIKILALFIFIWASDSGAYCVGSMIGKRKLFPRISPNKSWEGSIGGAIVAIIASLIIAYYNPILSYGQWVGFALVVTVFGTWGDLIESLIKRQLNIKDSGNILPGHGGFLDRFDSTLIAVPAVVVYLYILSLI